MGRCAETSALGDSRTLSDYDSPRDYTEPQAKATAGKYCTNQLCWIVKLHLGSLRQRFNRSAMGRKGGKGDSDSTIIQVRDFVKDRRRAAPRMSDKFVLDWPAAETALHRSLSQ